MNENRKKVLGFIIAGLLIFSLAGTGGYVGSMLANKFSNGGATPQIIKTSATDKATNDIAKIASSAADSVVEITTETANTSNFMQQFVSEGAGSGVVITEDGYIITNNHVINGANKISVRMKDGSEHNAKLIGSDANNDIAVIKIEAKKLKVAAIGDSDKLNVGETVVAIGNPLGELGGTVTEGIISATSRQISIDGVEMTLLQTSAAINPGNSGGGLFNTNGELIGVVNAKSSGADVEGLGFAIPSNTAIDIAEQIMKQGYADGNYVLGIRMLEVNTDEVAKQYNVDAKGIYVYESLQGGNAFKAGIKSGDRLLTINGKKIDKAETAQKIVKNVKKGEVLKIVIERDGKEIKIEINI